MISLLFAGILCLTFDDSHWENWEKALPVFEKHGAKATFFPERGSERRGAGLPQKA